ncbi:bifunctional phosphopantothenoylcysteine decarboxylase/phosphopantothenate--cysteine ligase CoaBC [Brotaphodocola catenula]|uniref:Coenzyme A biosynthesis bifunctional protein CoaBC n=1 Tax=Brotaphodocola catenula TaxID=2885361 RepID=A0AAE3DK23_9FIRM|nr:bifunctional phosphopantothenoylcysteine decarboxylase/phosphopantothenate--cysteine ligase CoaBC [Brotaphodocola catenula]MCC2163501.1 bifunctional phosphopantothenoylcysteine decarboxylase/phosphopantothenate--cysteine ligase CoaBC [Brotaphodocola catenula]
MLQGKTVVIGVTGGIAAYKIASLVSMLKKQHANVRVIMTENATNFITPVTFESLTGTKCLVDTFDRNFEFQVEHVSLAKQADIFMIAPATANVIAKVAHGLADDMLTTTFLACKKPKYIVPAMNTQMYENPITQDNLEICRKYGMHVIEPASGYLACGDTGAGKMPEPETLFEYILQEIAFPKDLAGKKILVTAGPTQEAIDPVRYITNHSTGKMGYAIARAGARRGAEVTLVSGPVNQIVPLGVTLVPVVSARDMFEAVTSRSAKQDAIIKSAAVADYRPAVVGTEKTKKSDGDMSIALERTDDILSWLGDHRREGQFLCGFSMETQNMLENSKAKLEKKHVDMIVANNLKTAGAGFGTDTNVVTLITKDGAEDLEKMSKDQVAHVLLDRIFHR